MSDLVLYCSLDPQDAFLIEWYNYYVQIYQLDLVVQGAIKLELLNIECLFHQDRSSVN